MQQKNAKRLVLNKKTVSILQANEMISLKGGLLVKDANTINGSMIMCSQSDSFVACGSCFGDCQSNSTVCPLPFTIQI
jgi:hypothetical protein